jgi:hypothetical protein
MNGNHEIVEFFGSREKTEIVLDECQVCLFQWNLENEVYVKQPPVLVIKWEEKKGV